MRGKRGGRVVFAAEVKGSCLVGAIFFFVSFKPALFHEISLFKKREQKFELPKTLRSFGQQQQLLCIWRGGNPIFFPQKRAKQEPMCDNNTTDIFPQKNVRIFRQNWACPRARASSFSIFFWKARTLWPLRQTVSLSPSPPRSNEVFRMAATVVKTSLFCLDYRSAPILLSDGGWKSVGAAAKEGREEKRLRRSKK